MAPDVLTSKVEGVDSQILLCLHKTKNEGGPLFTRCSPLPGGPVLQPGPGHREAQPLPALAARAPREGQGGTSPAPFQKRLGVEPVLCYRGVHRTRSCAGRKGKKEFLFLPLINILNFFSGGFVGVFVGFFAVTFVLYKLLVHFLVAQFRC